MSSMVKLTIRVDRGVLQCARARAQREGTSVQEVLREQLRRYAAGDLLPKTARPFQAEWLEEVAKRVKASGASVPVSAILQARDADRR